MAVWEPVITLVVRLVVRLSVGEQFSHLMYNFQILDTECSTSEIWHGQWLHFDGTLSWLSDFYCSLVGIWKHYIRLYLASSCHSVLYFKDMADMDDDYIGGTGMHEWFLLPQVDISKPLRLDLTLQVLVTQYTTLELWQTWTKTTLKRDCYAWMISTASSIGTQTFIWVGMRKPLTFNLSIASIGHSAVYLGNMTNMDDYILMGNCHAWMISVAPGWGFKKKVTV